MEAEQPQEEQPQVEEENNEEGETPSNIVQEAQAVRKLLAKDIEKYESLKREIDEARAVQMLSGTAGGSKEKQEAEKEETPAEYMQRVMRNEI